MKSEKQMKRTSYVVVDPSSLLVLYMSFPVPVPAPVGFLVDSVVVVVVDGAVVAAAEREVVLAAVLFVGVVVLDGTELGVAPLHVPVESVAVFGVRIHQTYQLRDWNVVVVEVVIVVTVVVVSDGVGGRKTKESRGDSVRKKRTEAVGEKKKNLTYVLLARLHTPSGY